MKNLFFRFSCAVLLCYCLTGCGSIQHKSSTDTAQAQGTKAPPKTADDFSISSDSENETVDETSSADAATPSASESVTQQELLTGATALYSNGQEISFDPSWQYADFSAINSGTATIYLADSDRKDIVVGVNAGHGTSGGASVKTQCHPDGSPKTTGGSTAQGAIYATAVSGGMTFNDGTAESTVTLQMAQILKDKLLAQGYDVLMVRNSDDVQLDNVARTVVCNNVADCHISLHWDGDGLGYDKGCFYISVPDGLKSMEPVASHWQEHDALGASLVEGLRTEGMTIYQNGSMNIDLTQTSYSTIPSVDMELGNASSDHSDSTLNSLADGLDSMLILEIRILIELFILFFKEVIMEPLIRVKNMYKIYNPGENEVRALDDVSLEINQGEFIAIVGHSGSGKSTFMNMLGCLDTPDSGEYFLDGKDVANLSDNELSDIRNHKIGFIFQGFNLIPNLDALGNVELPLIYRGLGKQQRKEIAGEALSKVGLENRMDHRPNQLSGGQQQRVAVARAIAAQPPIILADEPTGNLDSKSTIEIMNILKDLHKSGRTVIIITHDDEIANQVDRVVRIMDGKIVSDSVNS